MYNRAIEKIRLEEALKDHPVQPFMGNGAFMTLKMFLVKTQRGLYWKLGKYK